MTVAAAGRGRVRSGGGGQIARALLAVLALLAGAASHAHAVSDEAILAKQPPRLLSAFGFFEDMRAQKPAAGVLPFALATPLFSDHAEKFRFVHVPAGTAAAYDADEALRFPVGTALVKTFAFPADLRRPDENLRLVETRVLLRQEAGWQAWAYVWNEAQADAELRIAGAKIAVTLDGLGDGPVDFVHSVPNKNQCKGCHDLAGEVVPLGPKARNLNREHSYPEGAENQLARWVREGILAGAPDPAAAPAAADWTDASRPLDARARAWLDVNCAHCHRREGPAGNSGLFLTAGEDDSVALGIGKRPVAAGRGSGGRLFAIVPGAPAESILLHRVESVEPGVMMPELGRVLADPAAVKLLSDWIAAMR